MSIIRTKIHILLFDCMLSVNFIRFVDDKRVQVFNKECVMLG